jgi:hypothetical protein
MRVKGGAFGHAAESRGELGYAGATLRHLGDFPEVLCKPSCRTHTSTNRLALVHLRGEVRRIDVRAI